MSIRCAVKSPQVSLVSIVCSYSGTSKQQTSSGQVVFSFCFFVFHLCREVGWLFLKVSVIPESPCFKACSDFGQQ